MKKTVLLMSVLWICISPALRAQTNVSGAISTNTAWTLAGSPYRLTADVTVNAGVTLTIQPGVIVEFSDYENILVNGSLTAIGTAADSISFIGVVAQDGGIALQAGSSAQLNYTRFIKMGDTCCEQLNALSIYTTGTVTINNSRFHQNRIGIQIYTGATPAISNSVFESSLLYGIQVDQGNPTITASAFKKNGDKGIYLLDAATIQNSSFTNNGNAGEDAGIHIDAPVVPTITNNTFSANWIDIITHPQVVDDTYFDTNGLSRIYIDNKTIAANSTWHFPVAPETWDFGLLGDITVNTGINLTIQPGVQVRFSDYENIFVNGSLTAIGTPADSITFIGEVAQDGGIALQAGSSAQLNYTRFIKMGDTCCEQLNALSIYTTGTVNINNSRFYQNRIGIQIYTGATPAISNSVFESSLLYGIQVDVGNPTISGSKFKKNGDKGIYLLDAATIQNSSFTNNGNAGEDAGIHIDAPVVPTITNNTFSANWIDIITHPQIVDDTYFDTNGLSRIYIDNKTIAANSTWHFPIAPEFWDFGLLGDITVNTGVALTIQPGVQVRFSDYENIFVNGSLTAIGTAADSISFIGEVAQDGGIALQAGSSAQLNYTRFIKMGDTCCEQLNALSIYTTGTVTIGNSRFYQNRIGIQIYTGAAPVISNSVFESSLFYGIQVDVGNPTISGSKFKKNGDKGIYLLDAATIQNSSFTNNGNAGEDAGIHIDAPVVPTITNNTFSANWIDIITHPQVVDDTYFDTNGLSRIYIDNKTIAANSTWHFPVAPETWDFGLLGDITVNTGINLTIQPGVQVRFSDYENIFVNGSLTAIGTPADSITFIGEVAQDGGIALQAGSSAQLNYTRFIKMGDTCCEQLNALSIYTTGTVTIGNSRFYQNRIGIQIYTGAAPVISNSVFESSLLYGIQVDQGNPTITASAFKKNGDKGIYLLDAATIQNSSFTNNGNAGEDAGIHIDAPVVPTITNNTFSANWIDIITHPQIVDDTYFDTNGLSRIYIDNKAIAANSTWHFPISPESWDFGLLGDITVNTGVNLTIQPGVQVRFSDYENIFVNGSLTAIGTAADSITFVGEVAQDGGIALQAGSSAQLNYTRFIKMGDTCCEQLNALSIYTTGSVTIGNSRFYQNRIGIQVYTGAAPVISNSVFESSLFYGIQVDVGNPTISGSKFKKNGDKGIYLLDAATIQNSSFTNNGNAGEDAGIHIDAPVVPTITNNTFSANWIDIITHPQIVDDTYFDTNGLSRIYIDNKTIAANSTWHFPIAPEFWDFGLLGDITVNTGVALTIQPGVQVRFSDYENIFVNGSLTAIGTPADSITFIGEVAQDGGIALQAGSSAQLNYTRFIKMGDTCCEQLNALSIYTTGTVNINNSRFYQNRIGIQIYTGATPAISNSVFESSLLYGIQVDVGNPTISGSKFKKNGDKGIYLLDAATIQNSSFTNNGNAGEDAGIHIDAPVVPTINNNTFSGNWIDIITHPQIVDDTYFDTNGLSRIYIDNKTIAANSTWHFPIAPEFWDFGLLGDITVNTGVALTIQPGVQVRFSDYENIFVNGSLTAIGTAADSISFIGEVAQDGGIALQAGSSAQLNYTRFIKMGDSCCEQLNALLISTSAVTVANSRFFQCRVGIQVANGASPDINNVKIKSSGSSGIYVESGSPVITNSRIESSLTGLAVIAGSPSISNSCLMGNTTFGINNTGVGTVNAANNWWGHITGPTHATLNPSGLGNRISANVTFAPWTTVSCDFIPPPPVITITLQPTNQQICQGANATFATAATGDTGLQYQWQEDRGLGFSNLSNTGVYNGVATATLQLFNVPSSYSGYSYKCLVSGAVAAQVATNAAALTVNSFPTAPITTGNISCGSGTLLLSASGGTNGQYRWHTVATGGTAITGEINSSFTTPSISATTTYYVSINNAGCESSRSSVVAQITTPLSPPTAIGGSSCGAATVTISASGGTNGQYRWYNTATGGTSFSGEVNSSYITPVLSSTQTYYVAINNGTCESTRTSVIATINGITPTTTTGRACGSGSVLLSASGGTNGQYRWYNVPTGGTPIVGVVNSSYTTPVISATTTYYVAIDNGTCESTRTSVLAQIDTPPASPTTTNGGSCGTATATITASGGTNGQYRWYQVATGGVAIGSEVNSSYTTPLLAATTTYYVAINNGTCESLRTAVTAQINTIPSPPVTTGASGCVATSVALTASGGSNGQYRWYSSASGGTPIAGESNNSYTTPVLSTTTTFYVSIHNGTCESARAPVVASIATCASNQPPAILTTLLETQIDGEIVLNLLSLISDPDNNIDLTKLTIVVQPKSGAVASIDANQNLVINYKNISFTGMDELTIEVCDLAGSCVQQKITIEVAGEIVVYNGISPNGDNLNSRFEIKYINMEATKNNHVSIYNRWGSKVFEAANYNNVTRVFTGLNENGEALPSGTYFYKIEFPSGRPTQSGYLTLKH